MANGISLNGAYGGSRAVIDIVAGSIQDDRFIVAVSSHIQVITVALERI